VVSKDEAEIGIIPSYREYDRYGLNDLNWITFYNQIWYILL
jgi:hypothetical protein